MYQNWYLNQINCSKNTNGPQKIREFIESGNYLWLIEFLSFLSIKFNNYFIGDKDGIGKLIEQGTNVNEADNNGQTPLFFAAKQGSSTWDQFR